jgi:hypothetical protein
MKNTTIPSKETPAFRAERLKGAVCELLKCSDEQYNTFQYKSGMRYLKAYLASDQTAIDQVSASRIFWNWWRNHWTNRDEMFLCLYKEHPIHEREIILQIYLEYNSGANLTDTIYPNSAVLNESYAEMITMVVKYETETFNQTNTQ